MKSSKQVRHRKRLSDDIGEHDFEARKKMNWPGLRPSPLDDATSSILNEQLENHEKVFLVKRILDNVDLNKVNIIEEFSLQVASLQDGLSSKGAKSLLIYAVSVSANHDIGNTLSYLDGNFKTLTQFENGSSSDELVKLLYQNAYSASIKEDAAFPLLHILSNPAFKNDKYAFQSIFEDVNNKNGFEWLENNRQLLTEEQFLSALRSLAKTSGTTEGLTGMAGEYAQSLNQLSLGGKVEQAMEYAELLKNDSTKIPFLRTFIPRFARDNFEEADAWIQTIKNEDVKNSLYKTISSEMAAVDYNKTLNWAFQLEEGSITQAYALSNISIRQGMDKELHDKPIDWFDSLPEGVVKDRTEIGYALGLSRFHNDVNLEFTLKKMIVEDNFDRSLSRTAIESSTLPSEVKDKLLSIIE
jgi:hypothetical protein